MYKSSVRENKLVLLKGAVIYCEGDPAVSWYEIKSGVVRTCRYLANGSRLVTGFFAGGQIFGAEAARYLATAEAVTDVTLIARTRSWLNGFAAGPAAASHPLSLALQNAERRVQLLVLKGAPARLAGFLMAMTESVGDLHLVRLPMLRADIADYLAIDVATVSRILSRFVNNGLLIPHLRQNYIIPDIGRLEAVAGGEANPADSNAPFPTPRRASAA